MIPLNSDRIKSAQIHAYLCKHLHAYLFGTTMLVSAKI